MSDKQRGAPRHVVRLPHVHRLRDARDAEPGRMKSNEKYRYILCFNR